MSNTQYLENQLRGQIGNLGDTSLVYGSNGAVVSFGSITSNNETPYPQAIAAIDPIIVTALTVHQEKLYIGGTDKKIYVLERGKLSEIRVLNDQTYPRTLELAVWQDRVVGSFQGNIGSFIMDIESGEIILYLGDYIEDRTAVTKIAAHGDDLYVVNHNVARVTPNNDGFTIKKVTESLSDESLLVSSPNGALVISYHNHYSHPNGAEVRKLPDNELIATFETEPYGDSGRIRNVVGYIERATTHGDRLYLGIKGHRRQVHDEEFIWYVDLSDPNQLNQNNLINGIDVERIIQLACAIPYSMPPFQGRGNPLIAVPNETLERILG